MYLISIPAKADLQFIFTNGIEFHGYSLDKAVAYQKLLKTTIEWLAENPNSGETLVKRAGIFKWSVGSHTLIYTKQVNHICIERIVPQNSLFLQKLMD